MVKNNNDKSEKKKYSVVSIHYTTECDMNCGFCYKKRSCKKDEKPLDFWYSLVPEIKKVSNQIACLEPNELVFLYDKETKGLYTQKIKLLKENENQILGLGDLNIITNKNIKRSKEMMYKVICTRGREFNATENHLILTKRGLIAVKDLKVDEEIIINKKLNIPTISKINLYKIIKKKYNARIDKNGQIVIERVYYRLPKELKITPEVARLCGFYCSEGDKSGFTIGGHEKKYADQIIKDFDKVFNIKPKLIRPRANVIRISIPKLIGENIFQNIFKLGTSARQKQLGTIFSFTKKNLSYFLQGLYSGDGCIRTRKTGFSIEYKTSSEHLAEQLRLILETKMGVTCSVTRGINQERKIEGRVLPKTSYYNVSIYGDKNIRKMLLVLKLMPKYNDVVKRLKRKRGKYSHETLHQKDKILKIIKMGRNKKVVDISLKHKPNLFTINGNIIVHNCGGGEPFINIPFIKKFGEVCKKNNVVLNVTSNGRILMELNDKELNRALKDITLISLSYDDYKIKNTEEAINYTNLVKRIKRHTNCQVGSNLLINSNMFKGSAEGFKTSVEMLFREGVDRVFALCPKNIVCPDILKFKAVYQYLTIKYEHFYVDDLTKMILSENKYSGWGNKCHKGRDLISIDEKGGVSSCSFAKPFIFLKKAKELSTLKIPKCEGGFYSCPYLKRK